MVWYYAKDGRSHGPLEEEELRALLREGRVLPRDLVWNESMGARWVPAEEVPGLCGDQSAPPPVPASASVSCVAPVGKAWRGMLDRLFRPFSLRRWFALGVSAWLASLGENQGGSGGSVSLPDRWKPGEEWEWPSDTDLSGILDAARSFFELHREVLTWAVAAGFAAAVLAWLFVLWFRCRGKFMFLDNVVNDTEEISEPWTTFKQHARSLYGWHILYAVVRVVAFLPIAAVALLGCVFPCLRSGSLVPSALGSLWLAGALLVLYGLVFGYVSRFLEDFVIPVMYNLDLTATEAWGRFLPLLRGRFGGFLLYGVFYAVLKAAAAAFVVMLVLFTCLLAGCLMLLPVVGAVVVLPVSVFFRLYSVEYLAQFGQGFSVPVVRREDD